jgi:hypothetical protein
MHADSGDTMAARMARFGAMLEAAPGHEAADDPPGP